MCKSLKESKLSSKTISKDQSDSRAMKAVQGPQSYRIPSLHPDTANTVKFRNTRVRHAAHCRRKWRSGR